MGLFLEKEKGTALPKVGIDEGATQFAIRYRAKMKSMMSIFSRRPDVPSEKRTFARVSVTNTASAPMSECVKTVFYDEHVHDSAFAIKRAQIGDEESPAAEDVNLIFHVYEMFSANVPRWIQQAR